MNTEHWTPPSSGEKIPFPPHQVGKHHQIAQIARTLAHAGYSSDSIFDLVLLKFAYDVSDFQIRRIIHWALSRVSTSRTGYPHTGNPKHFEKQITPAEQIARYIGKFGCDECDLWEKSPALKCCPFAQIPRLLLETLFEPGDWINIVTDGDGHNPEFPPRGFGLTRKQESWLRLLDQGEIPVSLGWTWIRINPTDGRGISDANIRQYRFLLLEFDDIPIAKQRAFLGRIKLPISAIISSGGKSLHAWVRINAPDLNAYQAKSKAIIQALAPFGVNQANQNPSRLSLLPGVFRSNETMGENAQILEYLTSSNSCHPIFN